MKPKEIEKYVLLNVGETFEFNGLKIEAISSTVIGIATAFGMVHFDLSRRDGVLCLSNQHNAVFALDRGHFGKAHYERTIGVNCSLSENTDLY